MTQFWISNSRNSLVVSSKDKSWPSLEKQIKIINEISNQRNHKISYKCLQLIPESFMQPINQSDNDTSRASHIPYSKPSITSCELKYAADAAENGWGKNCYNCINKFEQLFKTHLDVKYAIATSSYWCYTLIWQP